MALACEDCSGTGASRDRRSLGSENNTKKGMKNPGETVIHIAATQRVCHFEIFFHSSQLRLFLTLSSSSSFFSSSVITLVFSFSRVLSVYID